MSPGSLSSAETAARAPRPRVAAHAAIRFNPHPAIRLGEPVPCLRRIAAARATREGSRDAASDALHAVVGDSVDSARRTQLIELRRDIHNDRVPRELDRAVDQSLPDVVRVWLDARVEDDLLYAELVDGYEDRLGCERERLRAVCAAPSFQQDDSQRHYWK